MRDRIRDEWSGVEWDATADAREGFAGMAMLTDPALAHLSYVVLVEPDATVLSVEYA